VIRRVSDEEKKRKIIVLPRENRTAPRRTRANFWAVIPFWLDRWMDGWLAGEAIMGEL
jgi:hypothetical protein